MRSRGLVPGSAARAVSDWASQHSLAAVKGRAAMTLRPRLVACLATLWT
jgi:hypothetical protein